MRKKEHFSAAMEFIARIVCFVKRVIVKLLNELQTDNQAFTYSVGVLLECYSTQFSQFFGYFDTICNCVYAIVEICSECDIEWHSVKIGIQQTRRTYIHVYIHDEMKRRNRRRKKKRNHTRKDRKKESER